MKSEEEYLPTREKAATPAAVHKPLTVQTFIDDGDEDMSDNKGDMRQNRQLFSLVAALTLLPALAVFGGVYYYFASTGRAVSRTDSDGYGFYASLQFLNVINVASPNEDGQYDVDDTGQFRAYPDGVNRVPMQESDIGMDLSEFDEYDEEDDASLGFGPPEIRDDGSIGDVMGTRIEFTNYENALRARASKDKVIMIKMINEKAADMAINFCEEILIKKGYDNYLFVSMEKEVCDELKHIDLPCYVHDDYEGGQITRDQLVSQLSPGQAMAITRVRMIIDALKLGYTVLFTGADTLYLKDAFGVMESTCGDSCNVAVSVRDIDGTPYANWAVHYVRPSKSTVLLYSKILLELRQDSSDSEKKLNKHLRELHYKVGLKVEALDSSRFVPASEFFRYRRFPQDDPCNSCVAIYEDRRIPRPEQVYELKEMGMWRANFDEYYTSRRRGYILYYYPYNFESNRRTLINELTAFRNALVLGQILGRIVVLPRFHCPESVTDVSFCSLRDFLKITDFDEQFGGLYREHSFPDHPEVSREVKRQTSMVYFIGNQQPPDADWDSDLDERKPLVFLKPRNSHAGATPDEIKEFFAPEWRYFLRLHSLYGGLKGFDSRQETDVFNRKLKAAFQFRPNVKAELGSMDFDMKYEV